ncbi:MAG: sulfatase-like hydrolase/transferase [Desulfovibrionaceae bacterium]|nr:sulfatase-like hydrolase/transferase [Desulfovibrionaceae bacterium]
MRIFIAIIAVLLIFITRCNTWIYYNFGNVTPDQIIISISGPLTGVDKDLLISFAKNTFLSIIFSICACICICAPSKIFSLLSKVVKYYTPETTYRLVLFHAREITTHTQIYTISLLIACTIASIEVWKELERHFHITAYYKFSQEYEKCINQPFDISKDFIYKYYRLPAFHEIAFREKKNMVLVLAESVEKNIKDISLIPNLTQLSQKNQSVARMLETHGTNSTICAVTAWHFGLPLKLPGALAKNTYYSSRGFLPKATSVFDILSHHGYKLVLMMGCDASYSSMDVLFKTHGNFEILDKRYWIKTGWNFDEYHGIKWGYSDKFILERAAEKYIQLQNGTQPFILFIETIDTHAPHGWTPADKRIFNDIRDAFTETDSLLNKFVTTLIKYKKKYCAFSIIGDHNFMGTPEVLINAKERYIYNVFFGDIPNIPLKKRNTSISAIDIAPSILHAAGATWNNFDFGLGVSVFSERPSLIEVLGPEKLNEGLRQHSKFYYSLY